MAWVFLLFIRKKYLDLSKLAIQTIISPLVTALLFLMVLSLAIGNERGGALGFPFITFLSTWINCHANNTASFFTYIFFNNDRQNTRKHSRYFICAIITRAEVTLATILACSYKKLLLLQVFQYWSLVLLLNLQFYNFYYIFIYTFLRILYFRCHLVLSLVCGQKNLIIWPPLLIL